MPLNHPLHLAVAEALLQRIKGQGEIIRDPACGGNQHIPLFVGEHRGRDTRMCLVDLLVVVSGQVRIIVEIEESGFLPTKICGKFLQAALATHFIHDSRPEPALPYAEDVLFIQVLDGSKCLKHGSRKESQAKLIMEQIRGKLPLKGSGITDYQLFFVSGPSDRARLNLMAEAVAQALA